MRKEVLYYPYPIPYLIENEGENCLRKCIPSSRLRRGIAALLCAACCLTLSSCSFSLEDAMQRLKAYVNGDEIETPPEDFVESRENDLYSYDVYREYVVLTGYKGESVNVAVPRELDGLPVTKIGELAFYYGVPVQSVFLPNTVTELEENAFYYCRAMTRVTLSNALTTIGDKCFSWCSSLQTVTIPKSVKVIPDYCFNECTSLEIVSLPAELTSVGTRAFSGCASLTELSFRDGVSSVGSLAFRDCASLSSLRLPGNCEVGSDLFTGCGETLTVTTARNSACWRALTAQGLRATEDGSALRLPAEGEASGEDGEPAEEETSEETNENE